MISVIMYSFDDDIKTKAFKGTDIRTVPLYIKHRNLFLCGIDPSKSGYGIIFRDANGNAKLGFEIKGSDSTLDEFSEFLSLFWEVILGEVSVKYAGQERVILAKAQIPMVTLNEIRVITNQSFLKVGIRVQEVNNNSWKHKVLPKELRMRSVAKGSLKHYSDKYFYKFKSDNITDALGISEYLYYLINTDMYLIPEEIVPELNTPCIFTTYDAGLPKFSINTSMSLQENADWIATKLNANMCAVVPVSILSLSDIYKIKVATNDQSLYDKNITELYFNVIGGPK